MKIVYISPHLSTGGCPQFLLKKIQVLHKDHEIHCIEYADHGRFTVQKNQIKEILGNRLYRVNDRREEIIEIVEKVQPDVVHLEEMPEYFMDKSIALKLYRKDRAYKIIETSHDSSFDPRNKAFFPDRFMFVSKYQQENMKVLGIPSEVCEYPIGIVPRKKREDALGVLGLDPSKKHVVHVGLFTPRKNQAEIIEYAKSLINHPIQFHFVGNQADNFRFYWEPLMKTFPTNCKWWDERKDVDNFYQAADLFLFPSKDGNGDKETSPLVIREAISYNIPSLIYNSPVYMGMYDKYDNIKYLAYNDHEGNCEKVLKMLNIEGGSIENTNVFYTLQGELPLASYDYPSSMIETMNKYGDAAAMYWGAFLHKELEKFNVKISHGDVYVDLGANIGINARYAFNAGASEIHCFEPDNNMIKLLEKNVPSAKIYPFAINKENTELELYHWPHNPTNEGPKYKVKTKTLRDVIKMIGKPIDYLKVDIELHEENLFDDVPPDELKSIKNIFVEHHNPATAENLCEVLRKNGYSVNTEGGYGQVYIYASNTDKFFVTYEKNENKITFISGKSYDNLVVSVKELDSQAVIWATKYDRYPENYSFWMIPAPKSYIDFENSPIFGGLLVEFYSNNFLVCKETIRIHPPIPDKPKLISKNITEPTYVNYVEFFVSKIYDKYLGGKVFDTVVDVGANVGLWTEYIRHASKCKKVYAVEPNKKALKILNDTFSSDSSVTIIEKAMSSTDGELEFFTDENNAGVSSLANLGTMNNSYKVQAISFKTFMKKYGVDRINLLKVDIETGEYDLFSSLYKEDLDKIDNIMVEYHLLGDRTMKDVDAILALLRGAGFKYTVSKEHDLGGFIFATNQ